MVNDRDLLTGERAADLLQTALIGWPGAVPGFRCEADRVHCRPGAETSVGYQVWRDTDAGPTREYLVATTADVETPLHVTADGRRINVWRHPSDPRLPSLGAACSPATVRRWLADAGVALDADLAPASELVVYRPLRRAVVRTAVGEGVWFTKVVRPHKLAKLERRHRLLDAAGIGPRVVASPADGVIVTAAAPGRPLTSVLAVGPDAPLPGPDGIVALLDRLPLAVNDLSHRPSWTDRVGYYRDLAAEQLPDQATEIRALAAEITRLAFRYPPGPIVPTHGDFHVGNIFCVEGRATTMIDVDTLGPGHRVDDLACLVAHLAVLHELNPGRYPRAAELAHAWAASFEKGVHPRALRVRVAGVLLSLVPGGSRARSLTRLDLARAWLMRAREV